jgi:glycosyltransferase involved in cell wall biosynthesis
MLDITSSTFQSILFGVAILTILLPKVGLSKGIPLFVIVARWLRWALFAGVFSYLLKELEISFRPDWVHFITGLAIWFVLETGYYWIAIKALSRSEIPLFPSFKTNTDGDEWPADPLLIKVRDWLRTEDFKRLSALKAELFEETFLRASIYESADKLTRLQILFIPKRTGGATACYTLSTNGQNDRRLITDNLFLPFGGYYPEGWNILRKPLIGSLKRLLKLHRLRLIKSDLQPIPFEDEPLEELNDQQRILERLNLETGFLNPRQFQEEVGKISYDGRYRLWKEMWLLAYLGKSVS